MIQGYITTDLHKSAVAAVDVKATYCIENGFAKKMNDSMMVRAFRHVVTAIQMQTSLQCMVTPPGLSQSK